jgi:hypothetical protein
VCDARKEERIIDTRFFLLTPSMKKEKDHFAGKGDAIVIIEWKEGNPG